MASSRSRLSRLALAVFAPALVVPACESDPSGIRALPVVNISVTPNALTLPVGASAPLAATVEDLEGRPLAGRQIRWSSSAPAIVEVSPHGVVTALAPGVASVGAYSDQSVGFARVVVRMGFRLPVSAGRSLLRSEIGSPTPLCPGGEGGLRRDGGRECSHAGISRYSLDFMPAPEFPAATEVVAAAAGVVRDVCLQPPEEITCGPNGPFVYLDHGSGFATLYAHLDPASVILRRKTAVAPGEVLGSMGEWGAADYPWFHFELRYGDQGPGANAVLDGVLVAGRTLTEYRVGQ